MGEWLTLLWWGLGGGGTYQKITAARRSSRRRAAALSSRTRAASSTGGHRGMLIGPLPLRPFRRFPTKKPAQSLPCALRPSRCQAGNLNGVSFNNAVPRAPGS